MLKSPGSGGTCTARLGVCSMDQLLPSQDSAKVIPPRLPLESLVPTAMHAATDVHDTADKKLPPPNPWIAGLGVGWSDQAFPSQASASVKVWTSRILPTATSLVEPTATQLLGEVHDTPLSALPRLPLGGGGRRTGFGVASTDQLVPFHTSANVFEVINVPLEL